MSLRNTEFSINHGLDPAREHDAVDEYEFLNFLYEDLDHTEFGMSTTSTQCEMSTQDPSGSNSVVDGGLGAPNTSSTGEFEHSSDPFWFSSVPCVPDGCLSRREPLWSLTSQSWPKSTNIEEHVQDIYPATKLHEMTSQHSLDISCQSSASNAVPLDDHCVPSSLAACEMVFDSNMNVTPKRQLRKKTRQEKDCYMSVRRSGGACAEHRANKRKCRHTSDSCQTTSSGGPMSLMTKLEVERIESKPPRSASSFATSSTSAAARSTTTDQNIYPNLLNHLASQSLNHPTSDPPAVPTPPLKNTKTDDQQLPTEPRIIVLYHPSPDVNDCLKGCLACPHFLRGCHFLAAGESELSAHLERFHQMRLMSLRAVL